MLVEHKLESWLTCHRCKLCSGRKKVVLGRGISPAPLLFIGEAPGFSEDVTGQAFYGRSGVLLNAAIEKAAESVGVEPPDHYITNIVGCVPTCWDSERKRTVLREPEDDEILACRPRLRKTITLVQPEKVVLLGKPAQKEAGAFCPDALHLYHPAYILRKGGKSGPLFRRFVRELGTLFKALGGSSEWERRSAKSSSGSRRSMSQSKRRVRGRSS